MPTDLFLAVSGCSPDVLAGTVPPSCRRAVERAPAPRLDGAEAVVELPEWRPRRPACQLVPSCSALSPSKASFRFEVSVRTGARWSPWVAGASVGPDDLAPLASCAEGVAAEIDTFAATPPAEAVRLRVRAAPGRALFDAPWLVSLSAWDGEPPGQAPGAREPGVRIAVPPISQMVEDESIRSRICSPASVGMVLAYFGHAEEVAGLAREMFHPGFDLYGVWPAAIRAAGRRGVAGYLLRFPDWASAAWCLARDLPVVASVRYRAGELDGAAVAETTGHLLVLTGWEGDRVLVNDPAARHAGEVARRYRLDQLHRVWLERTGVGYVMFTIPAPPAPHAPRL